MMRIIACIGIVTLLACTAFGQSTEKPPAFDMADVHASAATIQPQMSGGTARNGRFEIRSATMVDLIKTAYGVTDEKVFGGPNWLATDRFDVVAKGAANLTTENARLMLRTLLADRFGLKVHDDNKPLPAYVLTLGKGPHKLKKTEGAATGCQPVPQQPQPGVIPLQVAQCKNMTTAQIAETLRQIASGYFDKPVIDQTKLEGSWDFEMKWTGRGQLAAAGADGISAFDAVDKQLGLKAELQQIASAVVAVDSVNRTPTPNLPGVAEALPPEKPEFEAADIKPADPNGPQQGVGIRYSPGGRIDAIGSIRDFIVVANQLPPNLAADLVVGGPKFIETDRYQILAKTPSTGIGAPDRSGGREIAPPIGVALMMLGALLEDRFKLKTHKEDRPTVVYAINPPKETKMKKADPSERAGCKGDPALLPNYPGATIIYTCVNTTMADLAKNIQQWAPAYFDHPAVDLTGLEGGWNFTIAWTGRGQLEGGGGGRGGDAGAAGAAGAAADPSGGMSVFTAMEKLLGLKVEKGTHPFPVIVIDHVEQKPTD